jgi:hypothetical protein
MAMSDTLRQFNTGDEVHARLMAEHQESLFSEIRLALTMERKVTLLHPLSPLAPIGASRHLRRADS